MIDNVDQDEWFNLYLYLGSYWVNTSRDTRLDTILDTIPDTKSGPELRSHDQLIELKTENQELNARSLDTKVELNPASSKSLTEEGSVRGRSLHHLPDQPGTRISCRSWTTRIFQSIFSSQITGNEVSLISYRTSDVIGRLD